MARAVLCGLFLPALSIVARAAERRVATKPLDIAVQAAGFGKVSAADIVNLRPSPQLLLVGHDAVDHFRRAGYLLGCPLIGVVTLENRYLYATDLTTAKN